MTGIRAMAVKEWKLLLRDPGSLALLFIMPAAFILVFSLALEGVFSSASDDERMDVLVLDEDGGEAGRRIVETLEDSGNFRAVLDIDGRRPTRDEMLSEIESGRYRIAVLIPRGSTDAAGREADATVEILVDPLLPGEVAMAVRSSAEATIQVLAIEALERTVGELEDGIEEMERSVDELDSAAAELEDANAELLDTVLELHGHLEKAVRLMPPGMRPKVSLGEMEKREEELRERIDEAAARRDERGVDREEAPRARPGKHAGLGVVQHTTASGGRDALPDSVQQNVPGWTIFGMFWIVQILALSIIFERRSGAYARILVAPLPMSSYVLGKAIPYLVVNLVQALVMFGIGVWVLPLMGAPGLEIPNVPATALVTICVSLTAIGFGLLMASLSRSAILMGSVSAVVLVIMTALAGIMVPTFVMPAFMRKMSYLVPQGWALVAYQHVIVRGRGTLSVLPHVGVLLAWAAGFFALAIARIRTMDRPG
jgi:ABC-2 type transport system permease protein